MFTLLLVEDDRKLAAMLQKHLEKYQYRVERVEDFGKVMETFRAVSPHLVLLDVNLPRFDGFYWCRQLRAETTCPILFISAREGHLDQVLALENGADDYLTKPFHYELVTAKVGSHLRRAYGSLSARQEERLVEAAGLRLYPERLLVKGDAGEVELSQKEVLLLLALLERAGRVVSREKLLDLLWEDQHFVDDNTLNVYVTRIRKKLRELGREHSIETVRGSGYRFQTDEPDLSGRLP
ncbi:winged helix-turn-helix domain-containing protein [Gorillibacterium sp. sgz500922]|uniref:winged helix-turn-helix domain-containing protein n=1 Tax=Gorillibacterium sp. sgz500922 TaxID=3446694 RepID=UPI003F67EC0E